MLIDKGYAGGAPTTGRLPAVLAAISVRPEDIDAVLITHMHVDHISGLVADGRPVFPNAEVFIHRADVAYFTDPARAAVAPAILKAVSRRLQALSLRCGDCSVSTASGP